MGSVTYDFSDETVIVTGGGSGIGRAIARRFGGAGATVLVADVQAEPKDVGAELPTHERIREDGGEAEYVETDVTDPDQVGALVEAAREYGGVDVMMNNAGIIEEGGILEVDLEELQREFAVNTVGVFNGVQAAARDMIDRDDPGVIVNTISISATHAQPRQAHYCATKGGVRMITRAAALELAEYGIRVNGISPGQISTEMVPGLTEEQARRVEEGDLLKPVPLGRSGRPEDLAGAVCFLASDDADYVTGEELFVDGGWQVG
jgi:NAD(P)-dependent dehydrogenase (short-subunit alcohol dehydrogenase family)